MYSCHRQIAHTTTTTLITKALPGLALRKVEKEETSSLVAQKGSVSCVMVVYLSSDTLQLQSII